MNESILDATNPVTLKSLDVFDLDKILTRAFSISFNQPVIRTSFKKAGLWPFDSARILPTARRLNSKNLQQIMLVEELEIMMLGRMRTPRNQILVVRIELTRSGFVDAK